MKQLNVGIIGAGMAFERLHLPAYRELSDQYRIAAICDVDRPKARKWASELGLPESCIYEDFHQMVVRPDLDVVDIMVPIELNYQVTRDVAQAIQGQGKVIICEKPLAPDAEQAEAARNLPRRYGIPIMIAENYRYNDEINLIRDLVRQRHVGETVYFIQNRVVTFPADMWADKFAARDWRQHPEFPGGAFTDTGIHDLAGLRCIFGAIDRLQAFGRPQDDDFNNYAALCVNLLFKNGIPGQFSFYSSGKEMQRPLVGLRIFGTEGEIYLEERDAGTINVVHNDGRQERIPYRPQRGFYNELANLYQACAGREPISVTPELEYGDLMTVMAVLRSLRQGTIVTVDQTAEYTPDYTRPGAQPQQILYM